MQLNTLDPNSLQIRTTESMSDVFYEVAGSEISWFEVQPKTGTTFNDDPNSHRWTDLGIYSESDIIKYGITRDNGGLSDTMIGDIYEAYNETGLIVGNIASTAFRASFGPNLRLTIPVNGTSGSSVNLYTAFVNQNDSKDSDGSGPCSTWLVDSLHSESHPGSTYQANIGYGYDDGSNPGPSTNGQYRSGIMYLFDEDIYVSGGTSTEWSKSWSGTSRYTFGGSPLATFDGPDRSKAVGLINLDAGLITLFNPDLVSSFDTSSATGGTITSGLTFSSTDCNMVTKDRDLSTALEINTTLNPNTFTKSMNPSVLDAKQAGITDCDDSISITKICYYDEFGNLVATGLLDKPVTKRPQDFTLLKSSVTLDGGQQDSPAEDGRPTFG